MRRSFGGSIYHASSTAMPPVFEPPPYPAPHWPDCFDMRRFLSRSLSAPLPSNWRLSPSPSLSPTLACAEECSPKDLAIEIMDDEPSMPMIIPPSERPGRLRHASSQTCDAGDAATSGNHSGRGQNARCFSIVSKKPHTADHHVSGVRIVVYDPYLLRACKDVIQDIPGLSWQHSPQEVDLYVLLEFLPHLEQYGDDLSTRLRGDEDAKSAYKAVGALTSYLRKEYGATLTVVAELTSRGEITFDALFAIFVPRTVVLASCDLSSEWRAFRVKSSTQIRTSGVDVYDTICESIDVVDDSIHCACCSISDDVTAPPDLSHQETKAFGRVQHRFLIPRFKGTVRIDSLNVYPLKYHTDARRLRECLVARGKKWLALQGIHHVQYTGHAAYTLSVGAIRTTVHPDVNSFVLLDRGSFRRVNPAYEMPDVRPDPDITLDAYTAPHTAEELMLCPPVVYGLSIADQGWLVFNIEHVQLVTQIGPPSSHVMLMSPYESDPSPQKAMGMGVLRSGASSGSGPQDDARAQSSAGIPVDVALHNALDSAKAEAAGEVRHVCKEEVLALSAVLEDQCTVGESACVGYQPLSKVASSSDSAHSLSFTPSTPRSSLCTGRSCVRYWSSVRFFSYLL
ncbi:hypothetical protein C8Q78DRAFT_1025194 [Trametes maxima]|nr:hypothetical protein C8Q78DRAFT_1025194 [Trametes maxima]